MPGEFKLLNIKQEGKPPTRQGSSTTANSEKAKESCKCAAGKNCEKCRKKPYKGACK